MDDVIKQWWMKNISDNKKPCSLMVKDGEMTCNEFLSMACEELKYPIAHADAIKFNKNLKSVKNFPAKPGISIDINCSGTSVTKIDHPIACVDLNLSRSKLTSLAGIHKFVTCESINVNINPVKDSILGLLLIPGLQQIFYIKSRVYRDKYGHYAQFHKAIEIVAKYVGTGKIGVMDAQQELIDNDLEDFASL